MRVAKILPGCYCESRRDFCRETTSRRPKSCQEASSNLSKIIAEKQNLSSQNKATILTGISPIFCGGKRSKALFASNLFEEIVF